jgi:hypothetical protein
VTRGSAIFIGFAILAITCTSCPSFTRSKKSGPFPESEDTSPQIAFPASAAPSGVDEKSAASNAPGTFVITLRDQNDRGPEGIPIEVSGPISQRLISDKNGQVRITGPNGGYLLRVLTGCTESLQVQSGGSGSAYIVAGSEGTGTLSLRWNHRFGPGEAAYPSQVGDWYVGQDIELAFDLVDRCNDDKSPRSGYPTFVFKPSGNLQVVKDAPKTSDDQAHGHVTVRCTAAGDVRLLMIDSTNPSDKTDLITYIVIDDPRAKTKCANR